jgi:hypothetical protein
MGEELLPTDAFILLNDQAFLNEVFGVLTDFAVIGKRQRFVEDIVAVGVDIAAHPWAVSEGHFVQHYPEAPDVALGRVRLFVEQLWRHIQRCAANQIQLLNVVHVGLAGKPEISNLIVLPLDQYVFGLDIPVNVAQTDELLKPPQDVREHHNGLLLRQFAVAGVELLPQITIAEFHGQIGGFIAHAAIVQADCVLALEVLHEFDLHFEALPELGVLEVDHVDFFDGDPLLGVDSLGFVDFGE